MVAKRYDSSLLQIGRNRVMTQLFCAHKFGLPRTVGQNECYKTFSVRRSTEMRSRTGDRARSNGRDDFLELWKLRRSNYRRIKKDLEDKCQYLV